MDPEYSTRDLAVQFEAKLARTKQAYVDELNADLGLPFQDLAARVEARFREHHAGV
jgi:hypothetical protein